MASQKDEIPTSWASCTVADITLPVGKVDPKSNPNREIRYIDISGIDNQSNKIADTKTYTLSQAPSRARQIVQAGDVVFSTVRPYLRNIASVGTTLDGEIASTGFAVLRPAEGIAPEFLFYKTISQKFVEEISGKQYGASYPAVKDSQVRSVAISLPPSNEQRRIVEKIETLFARLDQGEAALRQVQKLLARYRQSVLKAAVTGELTRDWRAENAHRLEHGRDLLARILQTRRETWQGRGQYKEPAAPDTTGLPDLPEGWAWASVEQLASSEPNALCIGSFGSNLKVDDYREEGVPLVFVRHIRTNDFVGQNLKFVDVYKAKELASHRVFPGDLLITKMGDPPGDVCVYPDDAPTAIITADCIRFAISQTGLIREFVLRAMQSQLVQKQIHSISKGVAQQKVTLANFKRIAIPLPSEQEQKEIAMFVNEHMAKIGDLVAWCQTELTRSVALRQSILKDAFAGKLVPQDPADEPAAELLARIRASCAAAPAKTRKKASA